MSPQLEKVLETYFRTFNSGDEAGHRALWGPEMTYFGSSLRTTVQGLASLQGVWSAIREGIGIKTITPQRYFGDAPELAALVRFGGVDGHPSQNAVMVFRFDADLLLKRIGVHWDPVSFLRAREYPDDPIANRETLTTKDPRVQASVETFIRTFNAGNERENAQVLHPDLVYFGSLTSVECLGRASALGVFRASRNSLGIVRIVPKRYFGDWPEMSILMELSTESGQRTVEVMDVLQFDEDGLIRRLATLWNPLQFLTTREDEF